MGTILILGSGTQGTIIAKDIATYGYRVVMMIHENHNYGDDSKYVSKVYRSLAHFVSEEYLQDVLNVIDKENVLTLIPMDDDEAEFVSNYIDVLSQKIKIHAPDKKTFYGGYNKNALMAVCAKNEYPHPHTFTDLENIDELKNKALNYPYLIKPNITCGARGMTIVNSFEELKNFYPEIEKKYGKSHLQKFIKPGGRQVEVQLYIGENNELVASSVISKFRWYPEKAGSSCCAESIKNEKIVDILYNP